ncbi:RNA polymerase sigma factor [Pseudoalteromonas citrea]|uniref:RNA polymerase sigma factor n=1 Tax=Pseudoalteromonas citrea TaxID=43655 RepID=A0A5S3XW31_9GAMM|nr:RNA polymerase sigma factor [Pseudoalteromonas citrea]TMP43171.1 RNA polymerase sigma factor [Pseudoalteromonas citrea]TMP61712.1 RNA polymerase sigma factor [Pseudoalteromonas citrea]
MDESSVNKPNEISLNGFLMAVEKKAYNMALISTGNRDEALDIVQDAMFKFATHYADKATEQWKPLFYRIVQNLIMDWHRKQKVRRIMTFWREEDNTPEPWLASLNDCPENILGKHQKSNATLSILHELPVKQQQCFLLRAWEGLSVKETARAMNCSEGTIKTHFSRASAKLKQCIEAMNE